MKIKIIILVKGWRILILRSYINRFRKENSEQELYNHLLWPSFYADKNKHPKVWSVWQRNLPNQISSKYWAQKLWSGWKGSVDFRGGKRCMEKPADFHLAIMFLETFRKEHKMVIMAPNNITLLIVLVNYISKHLVCLLVCGKLRLKAAGGGKTIFLRKAKVMKQRP